ncbi:MAG: right-handed parallel beta-helix repeat-containing protein [Bacteroidales bacterium]|nr:right-handed parallel beta-helix repeat-containing protein [Bacteroidales bacterium]
MMTVKRTSYLKILLYVFILAIVTGACKKDGDGVLKPDDEEEPDLEILSGTLSSPLTLVNRYSNPLVADYKVPTTYTVASKLTIMPGVRIEMGPEAKITVTSQGSIRSMGTPDSNVVFCGRQQNPGYWDYIMINSYDSINQFKFTIIEHGGGNIYQPAELVLNGSSMMKFHNNTILHSERYGLYLKDHSSKLLEFKNNNIENCGLAPLYIFSSHISSIDSTTILSNNNMFNYIEVVGSNIYEVESWLRTDVPFYLTGATSINTDVIIKPGARFVFGPSGRILVKETGSLYAVGLETDSIFFTGAQNINGYWDCILFLSNNPYNEFKYVSLNYGGGYYYWNGCIYLQDAFFKISYCTVANSYNWGIYRNGVYNFENAGFNNFYNNTTGNIGP